jgi:hypothetical protein
MTGRSERGVEHAEPGTVGVFGDFEMVPLVTN